MRGKGRRGREERVSRIAARDEKKGKSKRAKSCTIKRFLG